MACGFPRPQGAISAIAGCCARAASGHATAALLRSAMNSRRFIIPPCQSVIVPCSVAFFRLVEAIAGGVPTHPRRGPARRRQHRRAVGLLRKP